LKKEVIEKGGELALGRKRKKTVPIMLKAKNKATEDVGSVEGKKQESLWCCHLDQDCLAIISQILCVLQ
jgi:hypothetical protein